MPLGLRRMDFESRWRRSAPSAAETPRPAATSLNCLAGLRKDRFRFGQMLDPAQDHVAVRRADLAAVAGAAQHVRRGHRRSAPEERIEDHVAGDRRTPSRRTRPARAGTEPSAIPGCSRSSPRSRCSGARCPRCRPPIVRGAGLCLPHCSARARCPAARSRSSISGCRASSRSSRPTRDSPPPARNLICCWRQKWNIGSHAFLKRFCQPPGTPLSVFRQQNSSTNRQPHCRRCASTRSITYRFRSPSSACALMFRK